MQYPVDSRAQRERGTAGDEERHLLGELYQAILGGLVMQWLIRAAVWKPGRLWPGGNVALPSMVVSEGV